MSGVEPPREVPPVVRAASWPIALAAGLVLCAGAAIAWVDTRPGWDDTGVTAGSILIVALCGGLFRVPPLLAAPLAAGPILAAELPGGTGVLLSIPFALAGAFTGRWIRSAEGARPGGS